jgi:hypothetical protein
VAISTNEARQQILDDLGAAVDRIAFATASLGEAYEQLSVMGADRLEAELYRPAQKAYGRAKRAHSQFAERSGLADREFASPSPGRPSQGVKVFVENAVVAAAEADRGIAEIQDSSIALESGDAELRNGLIETREQLGKLPVAAREFLRTLGR